MAKKKESAVYEDGKVYVLQAGTPVYIKTADVCALTGKSNQWIGQLTSQGTLFKVQTPHGAMFELADTMQKYIEMLESRSNDEKMASVEFERKTAEKDLKKSKAVIASLEAEELLGKMHRSEDVAAMTEDLVYSIRGALLALPGRLGVEVAEVDDKAECAEIIRNEIYKVLTELSEYKYDPIRYAERVRERLNKTPLEGADDDE